MPIREARRRSCDPLGQGRQINGKRGGWLRRKKPHPRGGAQSHQRSLPPDVRARNNEGQSQGDERWNRRQANTERRAEPLVSVSSIRHDNMTDPAEAGLTCRRQKVEHGISLAIANSIFERCDDSSGAVISVFHAACRELGEIAQVAKVPQQTLSERVFNAIDSRRKKPM